MRNLLKFVILATLNMIVLGACSDDNILNKSEESTLVQEGDEKISTFEIHHYWEEISEPISDLQIRLIGLDCGLVENFDAEVSFVKNKLKIAIRIPIEIKIHDGRYTMLVYYGNKMLTKRVIANFSGEMLRTYSLASSEYGEKLEGEGTPEDPFVIRNNSDFNKLCGLLNNDESHAAGLYFQQKFNFDLDQQGESVDDWGHANQSFAGIYDGNEKTIGNLTHIGNSTSEYDDNIGLFHTLYNGAEIKNLTIELGSCSGIKDNFGSVASCATGIVALENITVKGSLTGAVNNIGGLVGRVYGEQTSVAVNSVDIGVTLLNVEKNVGGVIGFVEKCSEVKIENVTFYDKSFRFSGNENVGGIVGAVDGNANESAILISNCNLQHTTSEANDNMIISAVDSCCGGLVGFINMADVLIEGSSVYCPVGGGETQTGYACNSVGGLLGSINQCGEFVIRECYVVGKVVGNKSVGGMIGRNCNTMINFSGNNQMAAYEDAAIGVYGNENVGGIFGAIYDCEISIDGKIKTFADVECVTNGGGVVGLMYNSQMHVGNFDFADSGSLSVKGEKYIGGLVGRMMDSSKLHSDNSQYATSSNIPSSSIYTPDFQGKVLGSAYVGGAVGYLSDSRVENLYVNATVTVSGDYAGGIAGFIYGSDSSDYISFSKFNGSIKGGERTGGIAGAVDGVSRVSYCTNYGMVQGADFTGGIIGHTEYSDGVPEVYKNVNIGDVEGQHAIGGVCGHVTGDGENEIIIQYCGNFGKISGSGNVGGEEVKGWYGLGGILGSCDHEQIKVAHCSNHGEIKGTSASFHGVGGIAGVMGKDPVGASQDDNLTLEQCANFGNVSTTGGHRGGILGYQEEGCSGSDDTNSIVRDCINHGYVTDGGGIIGEIDHYANQHRCVNARILESGDQLIRGEKNGSINHQHNLYYYYDPDLPYNRLHQSTRGSAYTKAYSFTNFDFEGVWELIEGETHPRLRDCEFQSATKPQ